MSSMIAIIISKTVLSALKRAEQQYKAHVLAWHDLANVRKSKIE